ncbi:hypothetical protein GY45DRAFT_466949 [Cubamyces sp. BRFM 1775]|nr:hypothetical protein GY45DRAFT_466949 [Cubamyces sp. BRFM 1775]
MAAVVPANPYELLHWNMKLAHQTYEQGYNRILDLLSDMPKDDLANVLGYCEAWVYSVVHHHNTEEESVFPVLNEKMDFSHEQEQHKEVHAFLDEFLATIHAAQKDKTKFDAVKLKGLVLSAKDSLFTHFEEELSHLEAAKMKEAGFTEAECTELVANMVKHAKSNGDPFIVVPFMRSHTPPEYKDIWPPMPWVLRKVVVPMMLAKRYSGYWKYAPYAMS